MTTSEGQYAANRRETIAEALDLRVRLLALGEGQCVPWHYHNNISDTFYVIEGDLRLYLQQPKEDVRLGPGESYAVAAGRPHLVTNAGSTSMTILVLQGVGEYDYVPLV